MVSTFKLNELGISFMNKNHLQVIEELYVTMTDDNPVPLPNFMPFPSQLLLFFCFAIN